MRSPLLIGSIVVCGLVASAIAQQQAEPRRAPRNAAEFDELFRQVSNWGRWGKDDQLGSANLVTDAKRKQAAGLVKNGVSVSLAHNAITEKAVDNPSPFEHTMNPGFFMDTYKVSLSRLRAQPHRRAVPHPLQGPDLQRLPARRGEHREGLHEARHRQSEERRRHARHPDRHSASEERAVSRAGHGDLRRGPRGVGEEGRREGVVPATRSSSAPAAGRGARSSGRGTSRRARPASTRRSRRGSRRAASHSPAATRRST